MEMEFMPEFTDAMSCDRARARRQIVRGKRTKRPRPCSPVVSDCVSSEISTEEDEDMANCLIMLAQSVCFVKDQETSKPDQIRQKTDKLSSKRLSEMTTSPTDNNINGSSGSSGMITKPAAAGFYVYECKTCNRSFPSFQALGGHRASHKKPKLNVEEKKSIFHSVNIISNIEQHHHHHHHHHPHKVVIEEDVEEESKAGMIINNNNNNVEKQKSPSSHPAAPSPCPAGAGGSVNNIVNNNNIIIKAKVHECSICGSEFTSGQALGGHMRKHRPIPPPSSINRTKIINEEIMMSSDDDDVIEKSCSGGGRGGGGGNNNYMLSLDLNLPPPELAVDDHHIQTKFQFTQNSSSSSSSQQQQRLIFSSPALVDCHY